MTSCQYKTHIHVQLFSERSFYRSVKAYATTPKGFMGDSTVVHHCLIVVHGVLAQRKENAQKHTCQSLRDNAE